MARRHFRILHQFNVRLLAEDIARRGWLYVDLGRAANVGPQAVGRFIRGEVQSPRVAAKFAAAMGFPPDRYLIKTSAALNKLTRTPIGDVIDEARRSAKRKAAR
jgi:hypothetical protein